MLDRILRIERLPFRSASVDRTMLGMITLYTWGTPNGRKVSIMLEECGLPYDVQSVDITQGAQFSPAFVGINPNSKIPAIVDEDGPLTLFESGAILVYLAEKTGRFLPPAGAQRYAVMQWLMFQMGGIGPIFGQTHHFMRYAPEPVPYAINRYSTETLRLYGVLDKHLATSEYLAEAYSIADMAIFPWVARHEWHGVDLGEFQHVHRWFQLVGSRSAVQRGMEVPAS